MKHRSLQKILVGDSEKNKKIPQRSINLLNNSIKEIISKQDIIIRELQDKVLRGDYNNFLLTYKIDNKYLGEIEGFPWILQTISQGDKSLISSSIKCLVCHNFAVNNLLKEQLPFFSINNKIFIPDGDDEINSAKGLPLCGSCYDNVKSGIKYIQNIENQLSYDIPNSQRERKLRFWLIPQLNDPNDFYLVTEYLKRPEKGLSSFRSLFELSSDMKYVQKVKTQQLDKTISTEEDARLMNFLTFTVLFYRNDKFNHMRLIEAVDGVYPKRLEELVKSKHDIDRLAKVNGNPFQFYFGMIIDFLEPEDNYPGKSRRNENQKDPGWMRIMSYIMASLFTNKQIDKYFISKILLAKAQFFISKRKMQLWYEIMLKATLVLEYLYRIDALSSTPNSNSEVSKPQSLPKNTPMVNDACLFLTSHSNILHNSHLRGICAIGMMVGIIIKAQQRYLDSDSAPFVSQLNRLEMDYDRLISMPRRVWPRLKHYDAEEEFNDLFTYLVDSEVSHLNPNSFATEKREIINLIFTIGMAHGFTIFDKYGYKDKRR